MDQSVGPSLTRSRFVLLDRPYALPGNCKVCGASDRPVVDFGANDEFGAIYFCTHCLTEVAKGALNLVDASELDEARLANIEFTEKLNSMGGKIDDYITNLRNLHDNFVSSVHSIPVHNPEGSEEFSDEDRRQGYGEVPSSESGEPDSNPIISSEGPAGVSASNSGGSSFFDV